MPAPMVCMEKVLNPISVIIGLKEQVSMVVAGCVTVALDTEESLCVLLNVAVVSVFLGPPCKEWKKAKFFLLFCDCLEVMLRVFATTLCTFSKEKPAATTVTRCHAVIFL